MMSDGICGGNAMMILDVSKKSPVLDQRRRAWILGKTDHVAPSAYPFL
jgi:hypothetical protein